MSEHFAVVTTVQPSEEPITLAEAKARLRYDGSDEDGLINELITAARQRVEQETNRTLLQHTRTLTLDRWPPGGLIFLPNPPAIAVSSIGYVDTAGDSQTVSSGDYLVDVTAEPARITAAHATTWPTLRQQIAAVTVTYTCGYVIDTPGKTKLAAERGSSLRAMYFLIGQWWRFREAVVDRSVSEVPLGAQFLLEKEYISPSWQESFK